MMLVRACKTILSPQVQPLTTNSVTSLEATKEVHAPERIWGFRVGLDLHPLPYHF